MNSIFNLVKKILSSRQKQVILKIKYLPHYPLDIIFCKLKRIPWHRSLRFYGLPKILNKGNIYIDTGFIACSNSKYNSIGLIQPVILKALRKASVIKIKKNVQISGCTISAASYIEIGNNVLIGSGALLTDGDSHPLDPTQRLNGGPGKVAPIIIEDNVFIGARSIILKGVTIGMNSVVGAGSVVVKSFPPNCVLGGNPAKIIKSIQS